VPRARPPVLAGVLAVVALVAALPAFAQTPGTRAGDAPALGAPTALRGTLAPSAGQTRRPARRRTASHVRPVPTGTTQRPVQGTVARDVEREVQTVVQRPVYGVPTEPVPRPRRRVPEADPYAPTGIRVGSFILRPAIEAGIGFSDNANATALNRIRAAFARTAAEARLDSDWSQNAVGLRLRYERQDYDSGELDPRTTIDAATTARLDITRDTRLDLGVAYRRSPDSATTYALPVTAVGRPDLETRTYNAGVTQRFGRASVGLRGQYDELRYSDTALADGTNLSNATRDVNISTVALRLGYEASPAFQPFVDISHNERDYRIGIDLFGVIQGSEGEAYRAGFAFDLGPKLRGEISAGWLTQRYRDPLIPELQGFTFDGNIAWAVTPLTTLRATARTGVLDTASIGAAGGITREFSFAVEHALLRNVLLTGTIAYGFDDFAGTARVDERTTLSLAANWRLNRNVALRVSGSHARYESTIQGNAYTVNTVEGGVRIEY
jgi:hypothetical protein